MMGSDARPNWQRNSSSNWNPTPPSSPANNQGWNNSGNASAVRNNWSNSNQQTGWSSSKPTDDALWSAAPGYSTGPVRRARSNSDSWGSPAAPEKRDAWEAVPGWSSRPENNTGWTGGATAAPPPAYSSTAASGSSWSSNPRGNDGWATNGPQGNNNSNNSNSRWAPAGWDPLPPPKAPSGPAQAGGPTGNWDGKRPSVDRTPAPAPVPAPKPADAPAPAPAPAPAAPTPEKAVSFGATDAEKDKDPRGRDGGRPTRGRGGATGAGGYYNRDRTEAQNAMRKSKSTSGLDRKYRPEGDAPVGGQANGKPSGRLFTRQMDERRKQVPRDASKALGVIIYGFPQGVKVKQFIDLFSEFGTIVNVSLVGKPKRHERAYAYIDYENPGCAAKAVEALKTRKLFDMTTPLEVRLSFNTNAPATPSTPTGAEGRKTSDSNRPAVAAAAAAVAAVAAAAAAAKEAKEAKEKKAAPPASKEKEKEKDKKVEDKDAVDLRTIHIANVPQNIERSDVEKVFGVHGDIRRIQIVQKPKDKRVYAFVSYKDEVSCRKALASIKDGLYFEMTEPLKAEYAKQQNPDKKRKAIDKPWKKGEALEKRERSDRKQEKTQEKKGEKSEQRRKSNTTPQRTVIFISSVPAEFASVEALRAKLGEFGNIQSIYVVSRHDPASTAQFALVTFEKAEDASKVMAAKLLTCVFPRQRRVVVRGIPTSATEVDVKAFFAAIGDVRKIETFEKEGGDGGWMIEFVRPESAARSLVKAVEDKFAEAVIKAEYAPSTAKAGMAANAGAAEGADKAEEEDEEAEEEAAGEQEADDDESSSDDEEGVIVEEDVKVEEVAAKEQ